MVIATFLCDIYSTISVATDCLQTGSEICGIRVWVRKILFTVRVKEAKVVAGDTWGETVKLCRSFLDAAARPGVLTLLSKDYRRVITKYRLGWSILS